MSELPTPATPTAPREWAIVECLNAFRDASGRPGEHKVPVTDLAALYTRDGALRALDGWVRRHPTRDFSMRRMTSIGPMLAGLVGRTPGEGDAARRSA